MTDLLIRQLHQADATALENLLFPATEYTLFLRYNFYRGGLNYKGKPGQGIFWGAFSNDDLSSVISLTWNGHLQLFAPTAMPELCNELIHFLQNANRTLKGINGKAAFVREAVNCLGIQDIEKNLDNNEKLYALQLEHLKFPQSHMSSGMKLRSVEERDLDTLTSWQIGYAIEALGETDTQQLITTTEKRIANLVQAKPEHIWILEKDGVPVSRTNFSAAVPDAVMVAGVWTPPEHRNKGYARLAVALSLIEARKTGVQSAYLFTNALPAMKAYKSIGFQEIGEYALMLFATPWSPQKTQ